MVAVGGKSTPGVVAAGAAAALLALGAWTYAKERAMTQWPTTEATVLVSDLQAHALKAGRYGRAQVHQVHLEYQYQVGGATFKGSGRPPGRVQFQDSAEALEVQRQYPVNGRVPVYYNPAAPEESYPQIGTTSLPYVAGALGLGLGGAAIYMFVGGGALSDDEKKARRDARKRA